MLESRARVVALCVAIALPCFLSVPTYEGNSPDVFIDPNMIDYVASPDDVQVRLGEDTVLVCRTRIDFKFCSFKSPARKLFTMDPALHYKRISYHGNNPVRDCGLKISGVSEEDNGVWKCEITLVIEDGYAVQEVREAEVMVLRTPQTIDVEKVDTLEIFGDSLGERYGGQDEDEWEEIEISLLPSDGDDDCGPMQSPRDPPQMVTHHEEVQKAEVIRADAGKKCSDYTQSHGHECVPYYQCEYGEIITDGAGLIDIRFGGDTCNHNVELAVLDYTDHMCQGSLDVCCKNPDFEPEQCVEPPTQPPPTQAPTQPPTIVTQAPTVHAPYEPPTQATTEPPTTSPPVVVVPERYSSRCGQSNPYGLGVRIQNYNDDEAQFGEWPHMCAILKKVPSGKGGYGGEVVTKVFVGGSSLIEPGVVLTAAHKVKEFEHKPGDLVVRCGEWDTQTDGEPLPHQDRDVAQVILHPEAHPRNLHNSIAILILVEDFVLDKHIDTVCLPEYNEKFDNERCFVTGWGTNEFGKRGQYQLVLKEVELPVVEFNDCAAKLKRTRLGRRFRLDKSFMCAGGEEGKDACRGDGGGPLVCPRKNDPHSFVQAGIVAFGVGCGEKDVPGVYVDVGYNICWIDWVISCSEALASNVPATVDSHLGLQTGCEQWQSEKQAHRVPKLRQYYNKCTVTWPQAPQVEDVSPTYAQNVKQKTIPEKIKIAPAKGY